MGYQVHFPKLSFQKTKPENPTVPVGDEVVVERGGMVPEWASPGIINALFNAGMIVEVGDRPNPNVVPFDSIPEQPRSPEQPDVLPSDPHGTPVVLFPENPEQPTADPVQPAKPAVTDNKEAWETYATSPAVGMDRAEAESLTKAKLIAAVNQREADKASTPTTPAV